MTDDAAAEAMEVQIARTTALAPDFVGLTRAEAELLAEQHGLTLRVIDRDDQALTADLRSNRITVDVRSGVVTDPQAG